MEPVYGPLALQVGGLMAENRLERAVAMLSEVIDGGGPRRPAARLLLAYLRWTNDPAQVVSCLVDVANVLADTALTPDTEMCALIEGHAFGRFACDAARLRHYATYLRAVLMRSRAGVGHWVGRAHLALGHTFAHLGDRDLAREHLLESLRWHQTNRGPFSDGDRLCHLGLTNAALASHHLDDRNVREARDYLARAESCLRDNHVALVMYLKGLTCWATNDLEGACRFLHVALARATDDRSHDLGLRAAQALASVLQANGLAGEARQVMAPVIDMCARAGLIPVMIRLQRLVGQSEPA